MSAVLVRDVEDLGRPAMLVKTTTEPILLLDTSLTHDQRMKILGRFIGDEGSAPWIEEVDDD